jgi:hypothetical protein
VQKGIVRFTPKSGRVQRTSLCLLRAKSGHPNIYSIISSARACIDGGTLIASALAVLRLMTNSIAKVTLSSGQENFEFGMDDASRELLLRKAKDND